MLWLLTKVTEMKKKKKKEGVRKHIRKRLPPPVLNLHPGAGDIPAEKTLPGTLCFGIQ